MSKIELLAPAGSFEALKAAIAAGADAVYVGGNKFGARAFANNFDDNQMIEAIKLAHLHNVKIYVTVNTLVYDHELIEAFNYIQFLYNNDVDAVIVQDLGLIKIIREYFPNLEIHASTQMTMHNINSVKFLKDIGVSRVVLARENTVEEIKKINEVVNVDTEVFVHGALCVCYSGQCLLSSLIGGRSGNRGRCAQPCRKKYKLFKEDKIIIKDKYLLSPKDLNTVENIDKLIAANIKSFKIEGRMKSPEYVAIVVSIYRKVIDNYYFNQKLQVSKNDLEDLTQIFNRQFTSGFLFNNKGDDYINLEKNNNTGVYIGHVVSCNNKKVVIKLVKDLRKSDGIYFENTNIGLNVSKIIKNNTVVEEANANDIVTIDVPINVSINTKIYKTTDVLLIDKAKKIITLDNIIPIIATANFYLNKQPNIVLIDDLGNEVYYEVDFLIEKSKTQSTNKTKLIENLNKLGNTPFYFQNILVNCDEEIFIPLGVINNLRREAIAKLEALRQNHNKRETVNANYQFKEINNKIDVNEIRLAVYVRTEEQLRAAILNNIETIYIDEAIDNEKLNIHNFYQAKKRIEHHEKFDKQFNGYLISNLGTINLIKNKPIVSNYNLNITNSEAINFLIDNGVNFITLAYEMNESCLKNLFFRNKSCLEVIIYGYQEAMISKHCLFASNCKGQCKNNNYRIVDEKNEKFNFYMDNDCIMHLLNSKLLILSEELKQLINYGYQNFRIQFTIESFEETDKIIKSYKEYLFNDNPMLLTEVLNNNKLVDNYTRGYFNKEIK